MSKKNPKDKRRKSSDLAAVDGDRDASVAPTPGEWQRKRDPLPQWKSSPIDAVAVKHWKACSGARDAMLLRTHTTVAPCHIVRANGKRLAR